MGRPRKDGTPSVSNVSRLDESPETVVNNLVRRALVQLYSMPESPALYANILAALSMLPAPTLQDRALKAGFEVFASLEDVIAKNPA